jgi:hypothetical protein
MFEGFCERYRAAQVQLSSTVPFARLAAFQALITVFWLCGFTAALAGEFIADSAESCSVWNPNPVDDESITWDGSCSEGKATGQGTVQWFEHGEAVQTVKGTFAAGRLIGHGTLSWSSGHWYEGEFQDSEFHGVGVFVWPDGSRYEGEFVAGKRHGSGIHTAVSGHRYEGPYVRGERHGEGRCFAPGFSWESCRWFDGERIEGGLEARSTLPCCTGAFIAGLRYA